jgi:hypothetical protein
MSLTRTDGAKDSGALVGRLAHFTTTRMAAYKLSRYDELHAIFEPYCPGRTGLCAVNTFARHLPSELCLFLRFKWSKKEHWQRVYAVRTMSARKHVPESFFHCDKRLQILLKTRPGDFTTHYFCSAYNIKAKGTNMNQIKFLLSSGEVS